MSDELFCRVLSSGCAILACLAAQGVRLRVYRRRLPPSAVAPPRDISSYLCVTVGQPAAVTEIRIHLDVFTITVLPYLSRVYSPKMCYRMPSRYHLVSYYVIFPLYNKGCRHIFGASMVVSLPNHYISEKSLSYKDISG